MIADNGNNKRPGRWYDVMCSEEHYYICSMPLGKATRGQPQASSRRGGNAAKTDVEGKSNGRDAGVGGLMHT